MHSKIRFVLYAITAILLLRLAENIDVSRYLMLSCATAISIVLFRMRCNSIRFGKVKLFGILADVTCSFIPLINGLALVFSVTGLFISKKHLYKLVRLDYRSQE